MDQKCKKKVLRWDLGRGGLKHYAYGFKAKRLGCKPESVEQPSVKAQTETEVLRATPLLVFFTNKHANDKLDKETKANVDLTGFANYLQFHFRRFVGEEHQQQRGLV